MRVHMPEIHLDLPTGLAQRLASVPEQCRVGSIRYECSGCGREAIHHRNYDDRHRRGFQNCSNPPTTCSVTRFAEALRAGCGVSQPSAPFGAVGE